MRKRGIIWTKRSSFVGLNLCISAWVCIIFEFQTSFQNKFYLKKKKMDIFLYSLLTQICCWKIHSPSKESDIQYIVMIEAKVPCLWFGYLKQQSPSDFFGGFRFKYSTAIMMLWHNDSTTPWIKKFKSNIYVCSNSFILKKYLRMQLPFWHLVGHVCAGVRLPSLIADSQKWMQLVIQHRVIYLFIYLPILSHLMAASLSLTHLSCVLALNLITANANHRFPSTYRWDEVNATSKLISCMCMIVMIH